MKRKDLIRRLEKNKVVFDRNGGNHDVYWSPITNRPIAVPRHSEIKETTAKQILKDAGV